MVAVLLTTNSLIMKRFTLPYFRPTLFRQVAVIFIITWLGAHVGYAQSKITYGLEAGAGVSNIDFRSSYATTNFLADDPMLVSYTPWDPYARWRLATFFGGYVRYQLASVWYLQSGINYVSDEDRVAFREQSFSVDGGGRGSLGKTLGYRLHQIEVPLMLGVRLYKQWRLYAGPSLGGVVGTGGIYQSSGASYQDQDRDGTLSLNPVFSNLRTGLGVDIKRWSLDFTYHQTLYNSSRWQSIPSPRTIGDEPFVSQSRTGGSDMVIKRMILTAGYRLR